MLKLWKSPVFAEDLFLEHYDRLIGWALQIAHGNRRLAEDLVHDAYIQFTFTRHDINSIQNPDAYLYGVLRVLHRSDCSKTPALRNLVCFTVDGVSANISASREIEAVSGAFAS